MRSGVKNLEYNPAEVNSGAVERWMNRACSERKRFFFEKPLQPSAYDLQKRPGVMVRIADDIRFLTRWFLNILLAIKHFGADIKREYRVSRVRQFSQMAELLLKYRVMPSHYRTYKLFKEENRMKAGRFIYFHTASQYYLSDKLYPEEMSLFVDKVQFNHYCKKHGFQSPEIVAQFGSKEKKDRETVRYNLPETDLFVKERFGMKGTGAMLFRYGNGEYEREGRRFSPEELTRYLTSLSSAGKELILQQRVRNGDSWKPFSSGALSTCRIVTMRRPYSYEITPLAANIRLPISTLEVDNTSAGGLVAPIDLETGRIGVGSCINPYQGKFEFSVHPDTGKPIAGCYLPFWQEIRSFANELHKPARSPFIGWDVTVTEDGIMAIEGSLVWSGGLECVGGRALSETEYPILYEEWLKVAEEKVTEPA
jgi:hypothetical protein